MVRDSRPPRSQWEAASERLVMRGSSERTIEVYLSYSKAFFSWYRPKDNPLGWWKSGRGRKRKRELRDKILSSEEIEALVRAAPKRAILQPLWDPYAYHFVRHHTY